MTVDEEIHHAAAVCVAGRRPIIIWGVGTLGQRVCEIFRGHALDVVGFVDGAGVRVGTIECGLPVAGPPQLAESRRGGALLVVASTWWREIGVNLLNRGLRFGEDFVLAQRQHSTRKWRRDETEAVPLFVGRGTYGFEAFMPFFPLARPLVIGAFCSIAAGAELVINHLDEAITTHPFITHQCHKVRTDDLFDLYAPRNPPRMIGNDVWIGSGARIMPGVSLGNGAIIGANAVVTRDVPDYAIVVGAPARVLRYRFDEARIALLNRAQWWNWPERTLRERVDLFREPGAFFALLEKEAAAET